jgi:two-component system sensor histidine kinase YesM
MPEWLRDALDKTYRNRDRLLFIPTHPHFPLNLKVTRTDEKVFSVARCIINVEKNYEPIGALFINMNLFIPTRLYTANVSFITEIIAIVCIFSIIVSIIITMLIARHISRPVEKLTVIMKTIENGQMNLRADESGNDEIVVLSKSFNSLIGKLQDVIRKQYEADIRQKDAELKALQAQINPHFLYNVLQSISSISVLHNIDDINIMAKSLGNMLRYCIKTEKSVVTVRSECEHSGNYLAIQKVRFGERLEYSIDVPRYQHEYSLLKLTLQTVIENSIIHGFNDKEGKGIIHMSACKEGENIVFDISENGKGMSCTELEKLNRELKNTETGFYSSESPSIGLKNVLVRLKIFYNYLADMYIESEEGTGTSVIIKVPAYLQEGVDLDGSGR